MRLSAVIDGALAYRIWGGRISIGGTHNGEDNPFTEYVKRCIEGKLGWSHHRVRFSEAVAQGLYRRICLVTKKPWSEQAEAAFVEDVRGQYPNVESANEELECIPKRGSGVYFSRLLRNRVCVTLSSSFTNTADTKSRQWMYECLTSSSTMG